MKWKLVESVTTYKDEDTGNEYVINPNTGKIFEINETAKLIIESIIDEKTENEIIATISSMSPATDKRTIIDDFNTFIEVLQENNIVLSV